MLLLLLPTTVKVAVAKVRMKVRVEPMVSRSAFPVIRKESRN